MKISVFTSNQPRHISLIERMASIADEVFAVQECNTVFPGKVQDFFKKSDVMQEYFSYVIASERKIFGEPRFLPKNVRSMSLKSGDLNLLPIETFTKALEADFFVVFGASFIKGQLVEELVKRKAINIHMGVSPYYRGSSCNFWAANDGNFDMVGATVHLLSKGLDSGPMLFHPMPKPAEYEAFDLGMHGVKAAHIALADAIKDGSINKFTPIVQDKSLEIKYTRNADFTDEVAKLYLENLATPGQIHESLTKRDKSKFLNLREI